MNWSLVQHLFYSLSLLDYFVLSINILMITFARPALTRISSGSLPSKVLSLRINLLRALNLIIILVYGYIYLYRPSGGGSHGITLLTILAILYLTHLSNYVIQYFIHKQYGKAREIGEKTLYIQTYQSRILSIFVTIFLTIISLIAIIQQLGFDSALQAGGVVGFIGVFFGLTQASWAPDIISGVIILNSDMLEEGDLIETNDGMLARVYKTKMFHTELINMTDGHRVMIRNAQLRDKVIHNLSKFASGKGLRECLSFNIGYDVSADNVLLMLTEAFETAIKEGILVEANPKAQIKLLDAGDHALKWGIIFYIKRVEHIISIRRDFLKVILLSSQKHNISLATPFTHQAT